MVCKYCGKTEPEVSFYEPGTTTARSAGKSCRSCWVAKSNAWRAANYDRWLAQRHKKAMMKTHGLTEAEYDYLYEDPICAGCGKRQSSMQGGTDNARLVIDHDHKTGKVRGLLCHDCNRTIATAHDDPDILRGLALYLEDTSTAS